jgi:hypothetical protein
VRAVTRAVSLGSGTLAEVAPEPAVEASRALWSGAQAMRTRWVRDLTDWTWTVDGLVATHDAGREVLRFDPDTGVLREAFLPRPGALLRDDALLAAVASAERVPGSLKLSTRVRGEALTACVQALFPLDLAVLAAVTEELARAGPSASLWAVGLAPGVDLLLFEGRWAGWRALDPVSFLRPMGWPEPREGRAPDPGLRGALVDLVYDWMTLDAGERPRPDEVTDPEEIAHLVGLRERARSLAREAVPEGDPTAGVAQDIAAQVHWGWGFFRVADAEE